MTELTEHQIAALTANGAKRWQKSGLDRLYLSAYRLGFRMNKQSGVAWWGNQEIPANYSQAVKDARIWVDAKTGSIGVRLGISENPVPPEIQRYYHTIIREFVNEFIERTLKQTEMDEAGRQAMNVKSAALKWRKGQTIAIDGKRLVIEDIGVEDTPFSGSARMICDARLIVRQYDGKYRRVDLKETE